MRKADVEHHSEYGRDSKPAVNVKVYGSIYDVRLPMDFGTVDGVPIRSDVRFTHDWMDEHLTERDQVWIWEAACQVGWEYLQSVAEDTFGPNVKVWSEGRSGGWAVVDGLPDFDSWDAIDLSRWARFAKRARSVADGIPWDMCSLAYVNVFEPWADAQVRDYSHAR